MDRYQIIAHFRLEASFQLTARPFFLFGDLLQGEVIKGDFLDLSPAGIHRIILIEAVEFQLKRENGTARELIGLGTRQLSEPEKTHLKQAVSLPVILQIRRTP